MNRGNYQISVEKLKQDFSLPDDFCMAGIEYDHRRNIVRFYGYSKQFRSIPEGNIPESIQIE